VLANVGYGQIHQNPKRIMESVGFKMALRELGLTEELITSSLVEDIKEKPQQRIQELKLGAEILQMTKKEEEPKVANTIYNFILDPVFRERIKPLEDALKEQLKNVQPIETTQNTLEPLKEE